MNRPVNHQLELVPAAVVPAMDPNSTSADTKGSAAAAAAIVDRAIAQAGADDFDWATDDSVVVKPRPGVAVYENKCGDVVVRTQCTDGDEDHFAFVTLGALPAVLKALKAYLP